MMRNLPSLLNMWVKFKPKWAEAIKIRIWGVSFLLNAPDENLLIKEDGTGDLLKMTEYYKN